MATLALRDRGGLADYFSPRRDEVVLYVSPRGHLLICPRALHGGSNPRTLSIFITRFGHPNPDVWLLPRYLCVGARYTERPKPKGDRR